MEFKRMEESYEVSYPTEKNNNSMLLKFVSCCKRLGIYFLFFELLKSQCFAIDLSEVEICGGHAVDVPASVDVIEPILIIGVGAIVVIGITVLIRIFIKKRRKLKERSNNDINDLE